MTFRTSVLPFGRFTPLFALDDAALHAAGGCRADADAKPRFPCRIGLTDAEIGAMLILVHYEDQPASTPFRASHATYVRADVPRAEPAIGEILRSLAIRTLSLRGFDAHGMLLAADLCEGRDAAAAIVAMRTDARIAYLHLHYARAGCHAARVDRV